MSSTVTTLCRIPRGASRPLCSPNGLLVAYVVPGKRCYHVEVNGNVLGDPPYDFVSGVRFSPDGTQVAFVGFRKLRNTVVYANAEYEWWDDIGSSCPTLTADNRSVVFQGRRQGKWLAIRDRVQIGGPYEGFAPGGIVCSNDSARFGYAVKDGDVWRAVVDGCLDHAYSSIIQRSWVFSPDSKTFAYIAVTSAELIDGGFVGEQAVVINGVVQRPWRYNEVTRTDGLYHDVMFSADCNRHAYGVCQKDTGFFFVVDGRVESFSGGLVSGWQNRPDWLDVPGARRSGHSSESLTFSPDSRHYAYAIALHDRQHVVRDGEAIATHERILNRPIHFSPDSKHVVYATETRARDRQVVWRDGQEVLSRTAAVLPIPATFSNDSSKVAYAVIDCGIHQLAIDGRLTPLNGQPLLGSRPVWLDDSHVGLLTIGPNSFVYLETIDV